MREDEIPVANLVSICGGAAEEVFQREMKRMLENIKDPSTDPDKKRKIILEFSFEPLADRSGAEVVFACTSKLAGVEATKGNVFFARQGNELRIFTRDPRQIAMFAAEAPATPQKQ